MQRAGWRPGFLRTLIWLVASALLLPLVLLAGLYAAGGYVKTPSTWWYPFIPSLFSDYYTTGPFAMTSNTREDNPVWSELPLFNKSLARLSYAMTLGTPVTQVAWLHANAEWADKPALAPGIFPNREEVPLSKALAGAGLGYDRISRRDLLDARVTGQRLSVGHADYAALLIDELDIVEPELLLRIQEIAQAGIPVIWQGVMPQRARGWADHESRDQRVKALSAQLAETVFRAGSITGAVAALREADVSGMLVPVMPGDFKLRSNHRRLAGAELLLLFNETDSDVTRTFHAVGSWESVHLLDPVTGEYELLDNSGQSFDIAVPARRTRLLLLQPGASASDKVSGTAERDSEFGEGWDWSLWQSPPRALHPYIRWWWPGNAVQAQELRAELHSMHAAGFGGVEIQTLTIGLSQRHLAAQQQSIYAVGTPAYFDRLKAVFQLARELDMAVDLTLGSGWSSGGPFIDEFPEQQLLRASFDVTGPAVVQRELPVPGEPWYVAPSNWIINNTVGEFDGKLQLRGVVAARLDSASRTPSLTDFIDISESVAQDNLSWQVPQGAHRIFAFYQNATAHNAVASAYPGALASSPVLDHLDIGGVTEYIEDLGRPWLRALAPFKPGAFFIDSFELLGELPWSTDFARRFQVMHGYDITPYLPLVFQRRGESKYVNVVIPPVPAYQAPADMHLRVREDYEATRQQLFEDAFLQPLHAWTQAEGIALRLQAHGGYGDYLDSYQLADIPEAEGLFAGGSYDFLKLATSAGHVAGRRVISSESFITMTTDFNSLDIEDYYLLAGNAFAAGINRIIYHGYAYHYVP